MVGGYNFKTTNLGSGDALTGPEKLQLGGYNFEVSNLESVYALTARE